MHSNEAQRRAEALFKKEQQVREAQKATAEYHAEQHAMREKTARLRALRLAREAADQGAQKGSTRLARQCAAKKEPRPAQPSDQTL
jgi:hypothetical protein